MSEELSALEESAKEVLIDLMTERVMSERVMFVGVQASSTRGVQASPSTACGDGPSRPSAEKRTKHRDDLENAKLFLTMLPDYTLPLTDVVSHDSVPRYFEYTMVTAYLSKGIHTVRAQQDKIATLKFSDFNLGDRKNYSALAPYKYLTRTKGKNSKIIPQPWTMNLTQSTLLNVMKIPHFGRHREVNTCVKLLLSCYHGSYLWIELRIIVDSMLIHRVIGLSMQGPDPHEFYPRKAIDRVLGQKIKDTYDDVEKGTRGYKVRKNKPTQVTGFVVDLAGKCVEGL
jgi:hypothetical protein